MASGKLTPLPPTTRPASQPAHSKSTHDTSSLGATSHASTTSDGAAKNRSFLISTSCWKTTGTTQEQAAGPG